jgi:prevent-host-death family protein
MKTSNISYLRNHLSEVIAAVREGETLLVLDRDKPVARLIPYTTGKDGLTERVKELQQLGLLTHSPQQDPVRLPKPLKLKTPVDVSGFVLEDRG